MKLYRVLMVLVLGNVLAVTEIDYKMEVYTTNHMLGSIEPGEVDELVQSFICSFIAIPPLALLLFAPESAPTDANEEYSLDVVEGEQTIQLRISDYDAARQNAGEMVDINLDNITLSDMGGTRRNITEASVRRLLEEVESDPENVPFSTHEICRLIALFVTAKDLTKRFTVVLDSRRDCHLTDESHCVYRYRKFSEGYYEVSGINNRPGAKLTNGPRPPYNKCCTIT
ncbi:uncharacterized protein LOC126836378 [Adelges cooleyi]|uniref:uncharacterized protein LOC126836378 n=1 Tax=Adelges cooleyi TaxID=133065 RepID=UPI00217FAB41|nr:uncharacterized protein LOC126836378 [Adelges cooleyi]